MQRIQAIIGALLLVDHHIHASAEYLAEGDETQNLS